MNMDALTPEEKFTVVIAQKAKEILDPNIQKYITHTRLNKIVCVLADYMNFDLTRGWFKFGCYSPTADKFLSEKRLIEISFNDSILKSAREFFDDINIYKIEMYIKSIREIIRKDTFTFYNWLYSELAPDEYRSLYKSSVEFRKRFQYLIKNIESKPDDAVQTTRQLEKYLFGIKNSLNYIQDKQIIDTFLRYYDLLKIVSVKFRTIQDKKKFKIVYNNLFYIFLNENLDLDNTEDLLDTSRFKLFSSFSGDLWTMLIPYRETLKGAKKEIVIQEHTDRIEILIPHVINALENVKEYCLKNELYPTAKEVQAHLKESYNKSIPLGEVYAKLG